MLLRHMNPRLVAILMAAFTAALRAQDQPPAPAPAPPRVFEAPPTLSAAAILKAEFYQGPNFQVRDPVPTYAGANAFTIDSDFGVFTADGNAMLMRRVAEIYGVADRVHVIESPVEKMPFDSGEFDLMHGEAVLHHISLPAAAPPRAAGS